MPVRPDLRRNERQSSDEKNAKSQSIPLRSCKIGLSRGPVHGARAMVRWAYDHAATKASALGRASSGRSSGSKAEKRKAVAAGVKGGGTEDGVEGGEGATRKCAVGEGTVEEGLGGLDKARGVGKGGDCGARAEAEAVQAGGEANAGADERIVKASGVWGSRGRRRRPIGRRRRLVRRGGRRGQLGCGGARSRRGAGWNSRGPSTPRGGRTGAEMPFWKCSSQCRSIL
eukprot:scaffold2525_cov94-Isochrysis_galbana.AAC.3